MTEPLHLAIVGHTNVGKTSFIRTLMRSTRFGEVSPRASTTRHVEGASLKVDGQEVVRLYDTPGMEDAMSLLDYIEQLRRPGERRDGPALIAQFLDSAEARGQFEQEAKVLRQLLASDAGIYVIDAREPVLPKYVDELEVLAMCGKPLFPVLNFVAGNDDRSDAWREALARRGLHALLSFDSVAPPLDGERRLYESLALMLEKARPQLQRLIADRAEQAEARRRSGAKLIAELLVDVTAYRISVAPEADLVAEAMRELRQRVRRREQQCVEALLQLYGFDRDDAVTGELPLAEGRWEEDLFHPETLKQLGVRVTGGVAAGATVGAGIDLMVGGASFGAGALLGALAGGAAQAGRQLGARLLGKLRGERVLSVDDAIIALLALRQQHLQRALEARGHAAQHKLNIDDPRDADWRKAKLPEPLTKARAHPEWSTLNPHARPDQADRRAAIAAVAKLLLADRPDA